MKTFGYISQYLKLSKVLSRGIFRSRFLFFVLLSIPLRKKIFGRTPHKIRLSYLGTSFNFTLRDGADVAVLREMFLEGEYDIDLPRAPKNILDIGGHIGASAIFFKIKYPDAYIKVYEPDKNNFSLLIENARQFKGIECVNSAIAEQSGKLIFYKHRESSISGSVVSRGDTDQTVTVSAISLDEALAFKTDMVKFDIEGAEFEMFKASKKAREVPVYVGELHLDLALGGKKEELYDIFGGYDISEKSSGKNRLIVQIKRNEKQI